jgi:hypothetical protein
MERRKESVEKSETEVPKKKIKTKKAARGPRSYSTDLKPIPKSFFKKQCRDLELLKCCAALSEWMHKTIESCDLKIEPP